MEVTSGMDGAGQSAGGTADAQKTRPLQAKRLTPGEKARRKGGLHNAADNDIAAHLPDTL